MTFPTFEDFLQIKKRLTKEEANKFSGIEIYTDHALIYVDKLYIQESNREFLLCIGRCEFSTPSLTLEELEARLFLFYCEEHNNAQGQLYIRFKYNITLYYWYW